MIYRVILRSEKILSLFRLVGAATRPLTVETASPTAVNENVDVGSWEIRT